MMLGAGGLHIEFTYCIPGNTSCQNIHSDSYVPKTYSSHSTYFIHKNYIHSNEASLGKYYDLYSCEDELSNEQTTSDAAFCFLQNYEPGENFTFYGNTVGGIPNAIYTGSVIPCYQSSEQKPTFWNHSKLNELFCWDYFHYEDHNDCNLHNENNPSKIIHLILLGLFSL